MNEWVLKMTEAKTQKERKKIIEEYSAITGRSISFCYKELQKNGYTSGRVKRKDAGKTNADTNTVNLLASMVKAGIRENGKKTMPVNVALDILEKNGFNINLKVSRFRTLLKDAKLDGESMKKDTHNNRMRSEYPNQVHQVDPSVALIYFAPESSKVKIIEDSEFYKNKDFFNPLNADKKQRRKKCLRYVLTDHYSGSICVKYYAGYGESAEYMYDFLLYAWGKKERSDYAFHGVPEMLLWDKGSANTSKAVTNALRSLGVKTIAHATGKSRVKGQVENANNIVETHFECQLRLEGVSSIEELNDAAMRFCVDYNTRQKIKRMGVTISSRHLLWQKIKTEQLKELPEIDLCRQVFSAGVQVRKVKSDLTITLYHPKAKRTLVYSLYSFGVDAGDEVNAEAVLIGNDFKALVWYAKNREEFTYEVMPIQIDEAGFDINAAVIGKEYKQTVLTNTEKKTEEIEELSNELKKGSILKSHSLIQPDNKFIYQKEGEKINLENTKEILLSYVEMTQKVQGALGYVPDNLASQLKTDYPNGVPHSYALEIIEFYKNASKEDLNSDVM